MRQHIDIVGLLFMAYGGLQLLGVLGMGLFVFVGGGLGLLGISEGDAELVVMGGVYGLVGVVFAVLIGAFAVANLAVGWGLRGRKPWARIGGMIAAALSMMNMPLGTLLGIYAFMVLLDKDVAESFGVVV
ncbi:MAG TPA: hypothetical protein ENK18_18145 [Deltaproteobacteria bacterium]|nr:hypothetical protein [Deltaproteobacteria bacterium]